MFCYRDMTFCTYWHDCSKADGCHRALTPDIMEKAMEWMAEPPICVYCELPDCFTKITLDKDN